MKKPRTLAEGMTGGAGSRLSANNSSSACEYPSDPVRCRFL